MFCNSSAIPLQSSRAGRSPAWPKARYWSCNGNDAFIEDSTARGSNSALAGLASIGENAEFFLQNGAFLRTTGALANNGYLYLDGDGSTLSINGALTNNGSISITDDTETLAGAVDGAGSFSLDKANLQFDSSVSAGQTITETGADALTLNEAQSFAAKIQGFRDRRHDRRDELCRDGDVVQFRREYRWARAACSR